jgi:hypothetical protein
MSTNSVNLSPDSIALLESIHGQDPQSAPLLVSPTTTEPAEDMQFELAEAAVERERPEFITATEFRLLQEEETANIDHMFDIPTDVMDITMRSTTREDGEALSAMRAHTNEYFSTQTDAEEKRKYEKARRTQEPSELAAWTAENMQQEQAAEVREVSLKQATCHTRVAEAPGLQEGMARVGGVSRGRRPPPRYEEKEPWQSAWNKNPGVGVSRRPQTPKQRTPEIQEAIQEFEKMTLRTMQCIKKKRWRGRRRCSK